jgi:AraC-like DNA-binding protein
MDCTQPLAGSLPLVIGAEPSEVRVDARIEMSLRIIAEGNASIRFSLADTSRTLGLSEAHLLRLFHREVGRTFRRHLREVRMIRAATLVKQNSYSIKQIALECGYSDLSNFYRDFRGVHAMTPRAARLRALRELATLPQPKRPTIATH